MTKTIDYNNQQIGCSVELVQKDFQKRVYHVNIFERNELVGRTSFSLNYKITSVKLF